MKLSTAIIQLDILDLQGRILKQQTEPITPGNNSLNLNIQEMPAGMYFLRTQMFQNIIFPNGLLYNVKIEHYRTPVVNSAIACITGRYWYL